MALLSIFCLLLALCSVFAINSTGHFLHNTDVHIDPNYDFSGDPPKWCHGRNKSPKLGVFGDHNDSPMELLEFMLREAKAKVPNPNLIIWTGDSLPHDKYDENVLFDTLQSVNNAISAQFPDAVLLPVLGNHDSAPGNSFTDHPAKQQIYEKMFKMWKQWIGQEGKFLVLNTNIYYESNPLRKELVEPDDPTGQFDFLQFELEKARQKGVPVHILGHVPPGAFEEYSVNKLEMEQIPQKYNQKLVDLLVEYAPQIGWIFFGHYHTDTFRVIKSVVSSNYLHCFQQKNH